MTRWVGSGPKGEEVGWELSLQPSSKGRGQATGRGRAQEFYL